MGGAEPHGACACNVLSMLRATFSTMERPLFLIDFVPWSCF
jgi:hypothetical protein